MYRCIAIALFLILRSGLASAEDPSGDPKAGQTRFMQIGCYECHGTVGQGGIAGMRIVPMPLPWVVFQRYVRRPGGQMAAFSDKVLSDSELADLYAYLTSASPGRSAREISLLNEPASN
jgi:ubiquinol-cytochrome c reductase cytochrome c subunit